MRIAVAAAIVVAANVACATAAAQVPGAVAVAAGGMHSCALLADGTVACWGNNSFGQLGAGRAMSPSSDSTTPVAVEGITNAVAITAGDRHSCALLATGEIDCWGGGSSGELGNGSRSDSAVPVPVTGITDAVAVSAGDNFTCAVLATNGRVKCWGDDFWGELGDSQGVYVQPYGNCLCSPTPVTVAGVGGATTVSAGGGPPAGGQHACATLGNGLIECWGDDSRGQLGNGIATSVCEPGVTCAQTHLFECIPLVVGCPVVNATSTATPALRNAAQVATGSFDSCGLRATGTIGCWGANNAGQLGNGQTADSSTPVAVTGITDAKAITAERDTSCALRAGGRVACWGANDSGQLGIGTTAGPQVCGQAPRVACSTVPVAVSGLADATAIDAGGLVENDHVCAAEASGGVVCWGANSEGQLGDGTTTASSAPVTVTGLP